MSLLLNSPTNHQSVNKVKLSTKTAVREYTTLIHLAVSQNLEIEYL